VANISSAQLEALLTVFFWPFFRILGLIIAEPVLGHRSIPIRAKVGLAILLAVIIGPMLPGLPNTALFSPEGIFIAIQQLLIGLAMGFVVRLALTAAETAGQLMGLQMGLGFAVFFDPQTTAQTAVMGQFLGLFTTLIFLATNGHYWVMTALVESFRVLPVAPDPLAAKGFFVAAQAGAGIFLYGLLIALPVIAALLVANVSFGILSRAAPQLNLFAVGFPVTLAVGFLALYVMIPMLGPALMNLFEHASEVIMRMLGALLSPLVSER
jgi:flagellar biosynthesis protein FliR